jgi:hypothetical protein
LRTSLLFERFVSNVLVQTNRQSPDEALQRRADAGLRR